MLREAVTAAAVGLPFGLGFAAAPAADRPEPLFTFADPEIVESSGLAEVAGLVATVNDSGDEARVFVVDPATGETVGVTRWEGAAVDVEALAPGPGGSVWVGDIGDNAASRETVSVTRVPVGRGDRSVPGESFRLRYPDGPRDAEALLAVPGGDRLVVVSKSVFGSQVFLTAGPPRADRTQRLRSLGRVMPVVTDGAFFPDGGHVVLRDYSRARVYTWPELAEVGEVDLPEQPQGESIAVTGDGRILVGTEGVRSPVHEVELPRRVTRAMAAPDEPSATATPDGSHRSREGSELPEDDPGFRDPTQWLIGTGLLAVAFLVLWRALRPR